MASEVLLDISRNEHERARLLSEYKYQLDIQSKLVHAKREGRKEGEKKGRQEGEKIGRQEGEKIGRQEGRQEGEQRIIELWKSGKSLDEVIKEYGGN